MGILRTDRLTNSSLESTGSVLFDGTTDSITIPSHSALAFGTADWTVEGWFYFTSLSGQQTLVGDTYGATAGFYLYKQSNNRLGVYYTSLLVDGVTEIEVNRWYHLAFVRHSGITSIYIDGVADKSATDTTNATITQYYIADTADQTSGEFFGYISNLRITRTAVYKQNFTVPKSELKNIPGTILLCCQSSSSTTESAVSVAGNLTANGDPTATSFTPDLKKDITDIGPVFADNTKFDTLSYMVPPKGTTAQSNRGRALIAGGTNGGGWGTKYNTISYIQIQSGGIIKDFGDLSSGRTKVRSVSSSSRAVFAGGSEGASANNAVDTMEYVTIATTGNVTSFGDALESNRRPTGGVSNDTRGLFGGGYIAPAGKAEVDHIVIATTGSVTDYGDLSVSGEANQGSSNSTRGVWMGGGWGAQIEYVTIASTGSGADFGDIGNNRANAAGASSSTRALCAGGGSSDNDISFIQFATLSSDSDFGDLTQGRRILSGTSNGIRGIFAGGYTPDYNIIDYVNIATTGNAQDFGDMTTAFREPNACSDSHGGIS